MTTLIRKVENIEQLVGDKVKSRPEPEPEPEPSSAPGSPARSDSSDSELDANIIHSNKVLRHVLHVGESQENPERLELETQMAMTETLTKSAGVDNQNPFWFAADKPLQLDIPLVANPLFNKKARAARYHYLGIF